MIPLSLFETLELLPLFPLTPKHAVQVEDMSGADAMAPLLRQEKTMFIQDRTSFRTPSINLPQRHDHLDPRQLGPGYMDDNGRVCNAQAVVYHLFNDQASPSTLRPSQSQRLNYSCGASSSRTHNYHNQVQVSGSGVQPYAQYGPSTTTKCRFNITKLTLVFDKTDVNKNTVP